MNLEPTDVLIRAEQRQDLEAIRRVTAAAFRDAGHAAPPVDGEPGEAALIGWLREDEGWIPELSLVATVEDELIGHVVATRAFVDHLPALGLGPVSVHPGRQRNGVGSALVRRLLSVAAARGETLVALLGDPAYYGRFGFRPSSRLGVTAPDERWGDHFQALALQQPAPRGRFRYAEPFDRL